MPTSKRSRQNRMEIRGATPVSCSKVGTIKKIFIIFSWYRNVKSRREKEKKKREKTISETGIPKETRHINHVPFLFTVLRRHLQLICVAMLMPMGPHINRSKPRGILLFFSFLHPLTFRTLKFLALPAPRSVRVSLLPIINLLYTSL